MSGARLAVSLQLVLMVTAFVLLASCASEGDGSSSDGSGTLAGAPGRSHGGGPEGVPGRTSRRAYAGHRRQAAGPSGTAIAAQPQSFAVDQSGSLYVAEAATNRILKIDALGATKTIAGTGERGYSGDGGPATSAELSSPLGVAVDSAGNVYIADSSNNVVRKIDPAGIISTVAGSGARGDWGDGGPALSAAFSTPAGLAFRPRWPPHHIRQWKWSLSDGRGRWDSRDGRCPRRRCAGRRAAPGSDRSVTGTDSR